MSRLLRRGFAVLLCALSTLLAIWAQPPGPPLRLKRGAIDPLTIPAASESIDNTASSTVRVVQYVTMPDRWTRRMAEATGARVLAYLPDQAFVLRVPAQSLAGVRALPDLRWEGPLSPEWKLAPDLGTRPYRDASRRQQGRLLAVIELWPDADADWVAARLQAQGLELRAIFTNDGLHRLLVSADLAQLEVAATLDDVAFIEESPEATFRNDGASWVIQTNTLNLRSIWDHGLHGEGQIMGNIDGRLDVTGCYFTDTAAIGPGHRKVVAYRSSNGQGADSHGTHTNGTMAGDKGTPGVWDPGDGQAFAAKISFSNLDDINGSGSAPSNLLQYLTAAHNDGARVHSNSWGDDGTRAYTSWSRDIDDFSYQKEDSLVMFAVSNGGISTTPENAKNVFAVGASDRDGNANNHCSGGTGPTLDGRRKPEIYAPGCSTVSAASGQACGTRSLTGTSMASPAVTGAAALVRQYFVEGWYPSGVKTPADALIPSGALLKATIASGAQDMTGVSGYPSNLEGWGRVNLERSLAFDGDARRLAVLADVRNGDGLQATQSSSYTLNVSSANEPLRITLAYTEPPATLLASDPVINNLNLKVTAPDGSSTYWGNVNNGNGESIIGGIPDAKNSLEQVMFATPATGLYTVEVIGAAVPQGPQGFALVATGAIEVRAGTPSLKYKSNRLLDVTPLGNNDGTLDPGETAQIPVTLDNRGSESMTGVSGRLSVDRPDLVRITRVDAAWPNIAARATGESLPPHFELTAAPAAACGQALRFSLTSDADQLPEPQVSNFTIELGNPRRDYPNGVPKDLPKSFFGAITSTQTVPDVALVRELDVSVDISHGNVSEIQVTLVAPSGKRVTLHSRSHNGDVDLKLRYDRDRAVDGPGWLDDFIGEQAQGVWQLAVNDNVNSNVPAGRINGWTLHLTADRALTCSPLSCGTPTPASSSGLLVTKQGPDLRFDWTATPNANGYHVLSADTASFTAPELVRKVGAVVFTVDPGGASASAPIRFYQLRAVNGCNWEGP